MPHGRRPASAQVPGSAASASLSACVRKRLQLAARPNSSQLWTSIPGTRPVGRPCLRKRTSRRHRHASRHLSGNGFNWRRGRVPAACVHRSPAPARSAARVLAGGRVGGAGHASLVCPEMASVGDAVEFQPLVDTHARCRVTYDQRLRRSPGWRHRRPFPVVSAIGFNWRRGRAPAACGHRRPAPARSATRVLAGGRAGGAGHASLPCP
jgi:hypothetical protein